MPRRRSMTFGAYALRRWRAVGLIVVTMAATLLFLTVVDRGHEPLWRAEAGSVIEVASSPDGRTILAVQQEADRVVGVHGYDAETGNELWARGLNISAPAAVAAGTDWFALATPFPQARLVAFHARGGNTLHDSFLESEPRTVAADGERLVVALRSGRVVVLEAFQPTDVHRFPPHVSAVDAAGGRIAVGTTEGQVTVLDSDGRIVVNASRPLQVLTVRLSEDGTRLSVGGRGLDEAASSGRLEHYDLTSQTPHQPSWSAALRARVSFADVSDSGRFIIGVEETGTRYTVNYWDASAGPTPRWTATVDGPIFRNDAGRSAGAAISSDGRFVAYAADAGGPITVVEGVSPKFWWTYETEGITSIAFADRGDQYAYFTANARFVPQQPLDAVLYFAVYEEPIWWRFPEFAIGLVALEAFVGFAGFVVAYAWYRRQ